MLVQLKGVNFGYDHRAVLCDVDLTVDRNHRIGIIGVNGAGKTTLLKIITGKLQPDAGQLYVRSGLVTGYMAQNAASSGKQTVYKKAEEVFSAVLAAQDEMRRLETEMSATDSRSEKYARLTSEYEKKLNEFTAGDGYGIDAKIKTVLNGMAFGELYDRVVDTLSGGEKTRLELALLLLAEPELLILDEPTNHLDFKTLYWLENYLATYKGTVIIVSHDRYFLDKTVSEIWEIENTRVVTYKGNYTKYKTLKAERLALMRKEYEKQQLKIAAMTEYAQKNRARASTAKSARGRLKQIENMEVAEKPFEDFSKPRFKFQAGSGTKAVLTVKGLDLYIFDNKLLDNVNFELTKGDRAGVLGENGTGKSTLMERLYSSFGKSEAEIRFGAGVRAGYYDQKNRNLNDGLTVLEQLWAACPFEDKTTVMAKLGAALLADCADKKVGELSGGQKAKLSLVMLTCDKYGLLILDEPTNHLDLAAREALEDALAEYDGTVLFVSHDRYFLQRTASVLICVKDGKLSTFKGGFVEYEQLQNGLQDEVAAAAEPVRKKAAPKKAPLSLSKRLAVIEAKIREFEEEEKTLTHKLYTLTHAEYKEAEEINKRLRALKAEEDALLEEWATVSETLDGICARKERQ